MFGFTRRAVLGAAAFVALCATVASAQTDKVRVGYTAVSDYAAAFAAAEEGFFKNRGLDVELQLITLNSTIPAALQSGSLEIGGPTPSVFLQAVDGGLDLVAIAGGSLVGKDSTAFGVGARTGAGIAAPQDFAGKRVGVPGIGAFLQVIFRKWLMENGVDPASVTFVEVPFPQMADVIRGGTVDAVVTGEPIMSRIVASGAGTLVSNMTTGFAEPIPAVIYAATRDYAESNPEVITRFREAIAEGAAFIAANPDKARAHIAKYTRLPPEAVAAIPLPKLDATLTNRHLEDWVKIMSEQAMLQSEPDIARINVQ